mgnify:CR=1 FL=1
MPAAQISMRACALQDGPFRASQCQHVGRPGNRAGPISFVYFSTSSGTARSVSRLSQRHWVFGTDDGSRPRSVAVALLFAQTTGAQRTVL